MWSNLTINASIALVGSSLNLVLESWIFGTCWLLAICSICWPNHTFVTSFTFIIYCIVLFCAWANSPNILASHLVFFWLLACWTFLAAEAFIFWFEFNEYICGGAFLLHAAKLIQRISDCFFAFTRNTFGQISAELFVTRALSHYWSHASKTWSVWNFLDGIRWNWCWTILALIALIWRTMNLCWYCQAYITLVSIINFLTSFTTLP